MFKKNSAPLYVPGKENYLAVLTIVTMVDEGMNPLMAIDKAVNQYRSDREVVERYWSTLSKHYQW